VRTLFIVFLLSFATACISDEESRRQSNSRYEGKWSGTFSGDASSTFTFYVKKEGTFSGEIVTSDTVVSESFEGYVNFNGKFDFNTRSKFKFSGFLNNVEPSQGRWRKQDSGGELTGTFILKKQN